MLPGYSPSNFEQCYLCPGNSRAAGAKNPNYDSTFCFLNDYSAVREQQPDYETKTSPNGNPNPAPRRPEEHQGKALTCLFKTLKLYFFVPRAFGAFAMLSHFLPNTT